MMVGRYRADHERDRHTELGLALRGDGDAVVVEMVVRQVEQTGV